MELGLIGTVGMLICGWVLIQKILIPGVPKLITFIKKRFKK